MRCYIPTPLTRRRCIIGWRWLCSSELLDRLALTVWKLTAQCDHIDFPQPDVWIGNLRRVSGHRTESTMVVCCVLHLAASVWMKDYSSLIFYVWGPSTPSVFAHRCTLHFDWHWEQFFTFLCHCAVSRCTTVLWSWFKHEHHARSIAIALSVGCQPAAWCLSAHHVVKQHLPPWG